jgi:hypothetical protein
MTYFLRDDNGPYDTDSEREYDAVIEALILATNHGKEIGCLFPEIHDPRHPIDMTFHVRWLNNDWQDLTESEIVKRIGVKENGTLNHAFSASSQWDFWWEA